jgi:probable HAF family extracellular repeat protein
MHPPATQHLAIATLALAAASSPAALAGTTYHLTDLGEDTWGVGLNANGDVAGIVNAVPPDSNSWVGVWNTATGTWTKLGDGDMVDGINAQGTVVGGRPGTAIRGVRWGAGDHRHIVKVGGSTMTLLTAISNDGSAYGYWTDAAYHYHPFQLVAGAAVDMGCPTTTGCIPYAANNDGLVVGHINLDTGRWTDYQAGVYRKGAWTNIGTLGGSNSYANAVDRKGDVVGASNYVPNDDNVHAFEWVDGVMRDLLTAGGVYSSAEAINDDGVVAGATSDGRGYYGAALWQAGTWTFLAPLVDNLDDFNLADAVALTNDGRILANAYRDNHQHALLLTPSAVEK